MVSIVPNQYQIEGTILSVRKDVEPDRFALLTIEVDKKKLLKGPEEWLKDIDDTFQAYLQEESLKEHQLKKRHAFSLRGKTNAGQVFYFAGFGEEDE